MHFLSDRQNLTRRLFLGTLFFCVVLLSSEVTCKRKFSISGIGQKSQVTISNEATRLVDGFGCSGLLQVRINDTWNYVCNSHFTTQNALVACREFFCQFLTSNRGKFRFESANEFGNVKFDCNGQEEHLTDCPASKITSAETIQDCDATYLVCKEKPEEPELALYSMNNDFQSFVYTGHSYVIECRVNSPLEVHTFHLKLFGEQTESSEWTQAAVDNTAHFIFPPRTNYSSLIYVCHYNFRFKPEISSWSRTLLVSVLEASYVRLVGESSRCWGRLEVQHQEEWRPVSQHQSWSLQEAAVVCRQLGCGNVIQTEMKTSSEVAQPVWRFYSDCDGSERALLSCGTVRKWDSTSTVEVLCSDILYPANISLTAEVNSTEGDLPVVYSPYSFSITCLVPPQIPGGLFSLVYTGLKQTLTLNQTAVNHSAVFFFDAAEKTHTGNYSCIYHNSVSGQHFSSQSQSLSLIVKEDVLLDDGVLRDDDHAVCSGKLLVSDRNNDLRPVTGETLKWDLRLASIVCRQLGCGAAVSTSKIELQKITRTWRFFSDCDGSEAVLLKCGTVIEWLSSTAIQVECAGKI